MREKPGNLIRLPQVLKRVGIGKSTVWAWVASGRFPAPIKLGPRMSVWREEDIDAFIGFHERPDGFCFGGGLLPV